MPADKGWHRDRWGTVYMGGTRGGNVGAMRERMGSVWRVIGFQNVWQYAYRVHGIGGIRWYSGTAPTEAEAMNIVEGTHNAYP